MGHSHYNGSALKTAWSGIVLLVYFTIVIGSADFTYAQGASGTRTILEPWQTVKIENDDRRQRLQRLSNAASVAPKFYDYIIPKNDLALKAFPTDVPLLRVVFDTRVFFDFDKAEIKPDAQKIIDIVAQSLKMEPPDVAVVIAGHTDSIGSDEYNNDLGLRRAQSVAEALVLRDIKQVNVYRVSFGPHVPLSDNATEAGRAQNRRVEFFFASKIEAILFWLKEQKMGNCGDPSSASKDICARPKFEVASVEAKPSIPVGTKPSDIQLKENRSDSIEAKDKGVSIANTSRKSEVDVGRQTYVIQLSPKQYEIPAPIR